MASRRMKIKVMANVGRRQAPEHRSVTPTQEIYHNLASPASPTKLTKFSVKLEPTKDSAPHADLPSPMPATDPEPGAGHHSVPSPIAAPMSPIPTHPSKSPEYKPSYKPQLSLQFHAPKSPVRVRSSSPVKILSPAHNQQLVPYVELQPKSPTKFHSISETRGPGRGPAANATSSNAVMSSLQKEIGFANVANMNSNETLRQRLQKGSSLNPTTKYHTARKEFLSKYGHNGEKKPDKSELTILHFTFYNPPKMFDDEMNDESVSNKEESMIRACEENIAELKDKRDSLDLEPESKSTGPRVKLGPDGELIIDEKSLVIETSESQRAKKQLDQMETVSGAGFAVGSSGIYRHKRNPRRGGDWTPMETVKFYRALTACGTDFSMMCEVFPNRNRAELKSKYKREDRRNPTQVSRALACQLFGPTEEFNDGSDGETLAIENSHTEDFSLPATKKARRKSLNNEKQVSVNEEVSKVVGANIVGDSPALEAFVRRPKKREKKAKEPKLKLQKGRPRNILKQKLSFVPRLNDEGAPELKPDVDSYFSFRSPFGQVPHDVIDTPIPLPLPPSLNFTPSAPVPVLHPTPTPKKPVKVKVKAEKKPKLEKVLKEKVIKKIKVEKPPKPTPTPKFEIKDSVVKVEKKKRIPRPKKVKEKIVINPDHGNSNSCPEILRFDPTDPLGFKIVHSTTAEIPQEALELEKSKSVVEPEEMPRLVLVNPPDSQMQVCLTSEENVEEQMEALIQENATAHSETVVARPAANSPPRNTRRSRNMKIKPKIRVPTGGEVNKNRQNTSIADEIEIEISCL